MVKNYYQIAVFLILNKYIQKNKNWNFIITNVPPPGSAHAVNYIKSLIKKLRTSQFLSTD